MKTVVINGSYHRQGNMTHLIDCFSKGLNQTNPDTSIQTVNLLDLEFEYCLACRDCGKDDGQPLGTCPHHQDGVTAILQAMQQCDILVFANPIHFFGATGRMKKFLERCLPCAVWEDGPPRERIQPRKEKKGVILLSCMAPSPYVWLFGGTRHSTKLFGKVCRSFGCGKVKSLVAGGMMWDPKRYETYSQKAFRLGQFAGQK